VASAFLDPLVAKGVALHQQGDVATAERIYRTVLKTDPQNFDALHLVGYIALTREDGAEAEKWFNRAYKISPRSADLLANRGAARIMRRKFKEGLDDIERALALTNGRHAQALVNRSRAYLDTNRNVDAMEAAKEAIAVNPNLCEAWSNKSSCEFRLGDAGEALISAQKAVELDPRHANAWCNLALALFDRKRFVEATRAVDHALSLSPDSDQALFVKSVILQDADNNPVAALPIARRVKNRNYVGFYGNLINLGLHLCDWTEFYELVAEFDRNRRAGGAGSGPFQVLSFSDDPAVHFNCAFRSVGGLRRRDDIRRPIEGEPAPGRIKVGFLSADLRSHAITFLINAMVECLDRTRFEPIGIAINQPENSDAYRRISQAFEAFHHVDAMTADQTAEFVDSLGIDILVDCMGHTAHARQLVYAKTVAPITVNYLGHPGTIGAFVEDYIIVDPVIAAGIEEHFSEKAVILPHCYQPPNLPIEGEDPTLSRATEGLPEDKFVFVSFCNNWKINPPLYDIWMEILKAVPDSVLWLLINNDMVQENLRKEAAARGVEPDRLVFARRVPPEKHLARQKLGDLFLDTFPYGAHTTASDALRAGLPIISRAGDGFPSRVAKSILIAAGLADLAVETPEAYRDLAVHYATTPGAIEALKARVRASWTSPMFDPALYARQLELAFMEMYRRWRKGEPPSRLDVRDLLT